MPERTPLADVAVQAGAVLVDEAGWLLPAHFGDATAEYRAARAQAALFDRSHEGKVELAGADAFRYLHNLCTNDILKLVPGQGCELFLTNGQARVVGHALAYHVRLAGGADGLWLDVGPGLAGPVIAHLDHYVISEQVELADRTRELAQLHLAGPQAEATLGQALGAPVGALAPLHFLEHTCAGVTCQVRRHDGLGLPGYDLVFKAEQAPALWQALTAMGARPAGLEPYQVLRTEAATPLYGVDIDDTNLPQEVGRTEQAISFTKGCYIGQETIARIRTYGHVNRSLVGLKLGSAAPAPSGAKVYRDGKEVGQVTSSVVSPWLGAPIALAYVRRGHQEIGTALEVETPDGRRSAEVTPLPFVPLNSA